MSNPYASGATSTRQSHEETELTWQPRSGDRRPSLDRCRLPGLSRLRPVLILSPTSASQEFHSAQAPAPQRPLVYVTASSLFRLERRSIPVLVVDSTTGSEECTTSTMPDESPSGSRVTTQHARRRCCAGNNCETVGYQDVKKNRPAPEGNRRRTATRRLAFAIERGDRLYDVLKLFVGKFRVDGKREHFFGRTFRLWERALLIPQITITILQMQGQGIIDL